MTTVGGTLGAPSAVKPVGIMCDDGVLDVPEDVAEGALSRGLIYRKTVATVGTGGGPLPWVYTYNGGMREFAANLKVVCPPGTTQPPVVGTVPAPPAETWEGCPYATGLMTHESRILARMINDVARHLGVKWQ